MLALFQLSYSIAIKFAAAGSTIGKSKFSIWLKYTLDQFTPKGVQGAFEAAGPPVPNLLFTQLLYNEHKLTKLTTCTYFIAEEYWNSVFCFFIYLFCDFSPATTCL